MVQGVVTGIRGLCNGIGPALFGLIFYIFNVNLDDLDLSKTTPAGVINTTVKNLIIADNKPRVVSPFVFVSSLKSHEEIFYYYAFGV